jgi:hypothetical protein
LVLSQGLSFYSEEDLLSIWTSTIMVWLYSSKSGLLMCVCCKSDALSCLTVG